MNRSRNTSSGRSSTGSLILILVLIIGALALYRFYKRRHGLFPNAGAGLPAMATKPRPRESSFHGCPPDGDGGDRDLNRLKNRVDEGDYQPVAFDAVEKLPWPNTAERIHRARWSSDDSDYVAKFEGLPLSIEGYLAGAREEGPESTNCHGADPPDRDYHIWLVKNASDDRSSSIVVEATPRIRDKHPAWAIEAVKALVEDKVKVRISGWLMLDPEHPDQVGKTRGTIWEIHPIMKIEYEYAGKWVNLDSGPPPAKGVYDAQGDSTESPAVDRRRKRTGR